MYGNNPARQCIIYGHRSTVCTEKRWAGGGPLVVHAPPFHSFHASFPPEYWHWRHQHGWIWTIMMMAIVSLKIGPKDKLEVQTNVTKSFLNNICSDFWSTCSFWGMWAPFFIPSRSLRQTEWVARLRKGASTFPLCRIFHFRKTWSNFPKIGTF